MCRLNKISGIFLFVMGLSLSILAVASESQDWLDKGVVQYQRENYDEALVLFEKAKAADPQSTRVSYHLGLTSKKMQDYKKAKSYLVESVEGSPKIKEALPELIEVCYQIDDVESAKKWIAVAEEQGMNPGQTAFIKGLVQVKDGKTPEAIQSFKRARELEPGLKQSANYQIGLAYLKDKSYDEAEKNFQEVVLLDPNTDIGRFADEYKKALDGRREVSKPLRMSAGYFQEYDDNVVLKPAKEVAAEGVGHKEDWREVATIGAELGKKFNDSFGGALQYNLYYTQQNEQHAFDLNSHTFGAVPSFYLGDHVFSTPVQYNYTWVDGDNFLSVLSVNPLANLKLAENQLGQLGVKLERKNYVQPPLNSDEDRDASRWSPGVGWFYFFDDNKAFLNLRYEYDSENTTGQNWDYAGQRVSAAVQLPIAEKWKLTVAGDAYWQNYSQINTSYNVKRTDDNYTVSAGVSYAITDKTELQLRVTNTEHGSNVSVYAYSRNVISAGVTARF